MIFIRLFLVCLILFIAFFGFIPVAMAFDAGIKLWNSLIFIGYILFFGSILLLIVLPENILTPKLYLGICTTGFVIPPLLFFILLMLPNS